MKKLFGITLFFIKFSFGQECETLCEKCFLIDDARCQKVDAACNCSAYESRILENLKANSAEPKTENDTLKAENASTAEITKETKPDSVNSETHPDYDAAFEITPFDSLYQNEAPRMPDTLSKEPTPIIAEQQKSDTLAYKKSDGDSIKTVSQTPQSKKESKTQWGINFMFGLYQNEANLKRVLEFAAGPLFRYRFNKYWSLQTSLNLNYQYSGKTYFSDRSYYYAVDYNYTLGATRTLGFNIPLSLRFGSSLFHVSYAVDFYKPIVEWYHIDVEATYIYSVVGDGLGYAYKYSCSKNETQSYDFTSMIFSHYLGAGIDITKQFSLDFYWLLGSISINSAREYTTFYKEFQFRTQISIAW